MQFNRPNSKGLFILLLAFWLLLNLLQAIYTEINPDEAYYFLYGKYLDWGYFDHPPMVALMVRISDWFFNGNLGVRFITVLLQIPTLILIWWQVDMKGIQHRRAITFFFIIAASLVMFVVSGFITTPDAPLLFFTALFLYAYQNFLRNGHWTFTIVMSIAMAALLYSKYQGVLVIGFVVLSNFRLLINGKFMAAAILALLLCTPHFYWQYAHDFPSFRYHLVSRSEPFKWAYFFEYLPNQMATFNPFTLVAALYVLTRYKPRQKFDRAQYFLIIGLILFFWLSTFSGHAEPQWTMAASVPMIILICNKIATDAWLRNYVLRFVGGSLVLVFIARILMVTHLLPAKLDFHSKEPRYLAIQKIAGNRPVVFSGSYQHPSLYTFFSVMPATVISSLKTRQTQFDIWRLEQDWHNQPVFIHGEFERRSKVYQAGNYVVNGFYTDSLQTTHRLTIHYTFSADSLQTGDVVRVPFSIGNSSLHNVNFSSTEFPVSIQMIMIGKEDLFEIAGTVVSNIAVLKPGQSLTAEFHCIIPALPKGDYKMGLGCHTLFGTTLNSDTKNIALF